MDQIFTLDGYIEQVDLGDGTMGLKVLGILRPKPKPVQVTGLVATVISDDEVTLVWDNAGDATSWDVYRDGVFLVNVTVNTYNDATVVAERGYIYFVRAKNVVGTGVQSDNLEVTTAAAPPSLPAAPTGVDYAPVSDPRTANKIALAWNTAADALNWTVKRGGVEIAGSPFSTPSFIDSGLTPSTTYSYDIYANNAAGQSAATNFSASTLSNSPPIWSDPGTLTYNAGDALNIDLATICGDSDGHPVTYALAPGSTPLPTGTALNGSIISGTVTAAGTFTPTVRASDPYDHTDLQITFVVQAVDTTGPTPPVIDAVVSGSSVTWKLVTPASDPSGIERYTLSRQGPGDSGFPVRATFRTSTGYNPPESGFPFTEGGLLVGTHNLRVSARDASPANNTSGFSNVVTVEVQAVNPNPDSPTNFIASPSASDANTLVWQPGPSGPAPDDYDLDFTLSGDSATGVGSGTWTPITIGNVLTYVHTGLTPGDEVFYRLKAKAGANSSGYVYTSSTPGVRTLYAAATFDNGTIIAQPSSRSNLNRLNSAIFIKAAAKTQGGATPTKWANTASHGSPSDFNAAEAGGAELYDVHLVDQEVVTQGGLTDTVRPREGNYFLRSMCYPGSSSTAPNYSGVMKHYEGLNDVSAPDPDNIPHNGPKCKPRSEMAWGNNAAYGIPYDTRFFMGFSLYVHRHCEIGTNADGSIRKGHGSGPQIIENNIPNDADSTSFEMHLIVPESDCINAATGQPIGAVSDYWWCVYFANNANPVSEIQGSMLKVALAPLLPLSNPATCRGKWTDFVFELCFNPFPAGANIAGWNFRAGGLGLFRAWVSSGTVDARGNRTIIESQPTYEYHGPIGLRPRTSTPGDMPAMRMKHYCYWIRGEVPGGTGISHPVYMGYDVKRLGFAENRTHNLAINSNLVTNYQSGKPTGFSDVCPRS